MEVTLKVKLKDPLEVHMIRDWVNSDDELSIERSEYYGSAGIEVTEITQVF